jgi:hypothetical protein
MKNFFRILLILLSLQLCGCRYFKMMGLPYFRGLDFKVPEGTPTFQQGYKDGCSTILFARGNGMYRDRYEYRYDPKLIGNPEYRFGHSRGQSWCFQNIIGPNPLSSPDRFLMPYGNNTVFDMKAGDMGSNWSGFFGGSADTWGDSVSSGSGLNGMFGVWGGGGGQGSVFTANPLWAGGSSGQFFGQ